MKKLLLLLLLVLLILLPLKGFTIGSDDTTWTRFKHIKTAVITYSGSHVAATGFVARKFDLALNPTGSFFSNLQDSMIAFGSTMRSTTYFGISVFSELDYDSMQVFCTEKGYDIDSMFLWMEADSLTINPAYAVGCPDTITSKPPDSVKMCVWGSLRSVPDNRKQEVWEWYIWKYFHFYDTSIYYGVMEDEATIYWDSIYENHSDGYNTFPFKSTVILAGEPANAMGWDGMTHLQITDSLIVLKQTIWLKNLMDTLYATGKTRFSNPAGYGRLGSDAVDDIIITGTGMLYGEGMWTRPLGEGEYFGKQRGWLVMDTIVAADTGYAVIWTSITPSIDVDPLAGIGGLDRCHLNLLTWYYMAADYAHFFLMISNQGSHANDFYVEDTLNYWTDAYEYDIGQPDSARYIDSTGTDGAGQAFSLYRRNYTRPTDSKDVIMYYRDRVGSTYGATSEAVINLGGTYQPLLADGTLGTETNTAVVRNAEGMIYVEVLSVDITHLLTVVDTTSSTFNVENDYTASSVDSIWLVWDDDAVITSPLGTNKLTAGITDPDTLAVIGLTSSTKYYFWYIIADETATDTSAVDSVTTEALRYKIKFRK